MSSTAAAGAGVGRRNTRPTSRSIFSPPFAWNTVVKRRQGAWTWTFEAFVRCQACRGRSGARRLLRLAHSALLPLFQLAQGTRAGHTRHSRSDPLPCIPLRSQFCRATFIRLRRLQIPGSDVSKQPPPYVSVDALGHAFFAMFSDCSPLDPDSSNLNEWYDIARCSGCLLY